MATAVIDDEATEDSVASYCPPELSQNPFSFDVLDALYILAGSLGLIYVSWTYGRLWALTYLVVFIATMIRGMYVRFYLAPFDEVGNLWIRFRMRGEIFLVGRKPRKTLFRRREVYAVAFYPTAVGDEIAIIYHPDTNTDTFVIVGEGSDIPFKSVLGQHTAHGRIGDVMKSVAAQAPENGVGTSLVFFRGALKAKDIDLMFEKNLHPDTAEPTQVELSRRYPETYPETDLTAYDKRMDLLGKNIREARDIAEEVSGDVTMAMVISVKRNSKFSARLKGRKPLTAADVERYIAPQMRDVAIDGLTTCGIENAHALGIEELLPWLRRTWDVSDAASYDEIIAGMTAKQMREDDRRLHFPEKLISVNRNTIQTDNSLHATLRITKMPKRVPPAYFRQLHKIRVPWLSVAYVGETSRVQLRYVFSTIKIPFRDAAREGIGRIYYSPGRLAKDDEEKRRQTEHYLEGQHASFNILVTVSDTSLEGLEQKVAVASRDIRAAGMKCKRIKGEKRQLKALMSSRTGINTL